MKHVKRRHGIAKTETTKLEVKTQYSESKQNEQKKRAVDFKKGGNYLWGLSYQVLGL